MPVSVTPARFEELVGDALDRIPDRLLRALRNVAICIDDIDPDDPELLGVYQGVALTERTSEYGGVLPDRIVIFRLPLMRMCDSDAELVREVEITVVHEIAHYFGIDDDRLHELGWG